MTSPANKSPSSPDEALIQSLKAELNAAADGLDMATQSRLNQARQQVLATKRRRFNAWWSSGLVVASLALVLTTQYVGLFNAASTATTTSQTIAVVNDLNNLSAIDPQAMEFLLASEEELELAEEMDLYTWLVAEYG